MKHFTEAQLEQAFIELMEKENYPHHLGNTINREPDEVIIEDDLCQYLLNRYKGEQLTLNEANSVISDLKRFPDSDLYESNKIIMRMLY